MKLILFIYSFAITQFFFGQEAFHNFGNLQIHQDAEVGFQVNLVNDGAFNENLGIVSFYHSEHDLSISGTQSPRFFDLEVDVINNLYLEVSTGVTNSLSYISGNVITPKEDSNIALDYFEDSFYILESNENKTDGYASYSGNLAFSFPIGDEENLRPLISTNNTPNTIIKAAYFNEDPNFPLVFQERFDTEKREEIISKINNNEFWDFDGPNNSVVTLTWNSDSEINKFVSDLSKLRVVGWHINEKKWKDLGNSKITGSIFEGTIDTFVFNPSDYEIITFGSLVSENKLDIHNLLSPNGDGVNETFIIEGIESYNNELIIFNRWGSVVYKVDNYKNDWNGVANVKNVINRNKKVPIGTYFYVLKIKDKNETFTGWVYITY